MADGSREALQEVYAATSAKLYGAILRIVRDSEEAQDLLQDVYVKVWRRAARFDPAKASPITWLCVTARNTAIDHLRRQGRQLRAAPEHDIADLPEEKPGADELLCESEDYEALARCLDGLAEEQERPIRLAFFDGLTHSQLADRLEVPLGTMKSRIRRGLQSLRGCLDG